MHSNYITKFSFQAQMTENLKQLSAPQQGHWDLNNSFFLQIPPEAHYLLM